jgi:uncharacterized iron-regulated membrane protein
MYNALFQIHFWIGVAAGVYVTFMSVTGSMIVYPNEISHWTSVEGIVKLHANFMAGSVGSLVNGIGGICLTLLSVTGAAIWWPGVKNWRRSLTVSWGSSVARVQWDLHSALGFWCFFFVLLWAVSGIYLSRPQWFASLLLFDPSDRVTDQVLFWLSELHFGRFNRFTEAVWVLVGLVPGALAFTGVFICCRRVIYKKPSNPYK